MSTKPLDAVLSELQDVLTRLIVLAIKNQIIFVQLYPAHYSQCSFQLHRLLVLMLGLPSLFHVYHSAAPRPPDPQYLWCCVEVASAPTKVRPLQRGISMDPTIMENLTGIYH